MNLRPQRREEPEINLAPLIDVVFLMLIFFMVSTTFVQEGSLKVVLPEATPAAQAPESAILELAVDADGDYYLDGQPLVNRQAMTLRRALEGKLQAGADRPLVIKADAKTPHQAVVTALDVAGQLGVKQVSIATVPEQDQ